MALSIEGISSDFAQACRQGAPDANGQTPLRRLAQGPANPCRHCLQLIDSGDAMLVLAHRPFDAPQPYAEVGPIFLHARACTRFTGPDLPAWMAWLTPAIVRGYGHDHWIRYETGTVVPGPDLAVTCQHILSNPEVAYVHIRSKYNCFQCRVGRG